MRKIWLVMLFLVGCGGGGATPIDAGQCALAQRVWSVTCQNCMETQCCAQVMACNPDAACQTWLNCGAGCGMDGACLINCTSGISSTSPAGQLFNCLASACKNVCS